MPSTASISISELASLIGTPRSPPIVDVRIPEDFAADPRRIPGAVQRSHADWHDWARDFAGRWGQPIVVTCQRGLKLSQGVAALLRHEGIPAVSLIGGHEAWVAAGVPLLRLDALPKTNAQGRTLWVTRERPKIDRIACPWLIRRFVDPQAIFLYVEASQVGDVASRFGGAAYDIEGAFFSHRGESCSFDTMLTEFGLDTPALQRLARIIRGADTGRLELAPESAGLLAASLGLSRMEDDDLAMLEAGLPLYDAFFRWARDASAETHNWPSVAQPAPEKRVPA